jgi:hypothetical protein
MRDQKYLSIRFADGMNKIIGEEFESSKEITKPQMGVGEMENPQRVPLDKNYY